MGEDTKNSAHEEQTRDLVQLALKQWCGLALVAFLVSGVLYLVAVHLLSSAQLEKLHGWERFRYYCLEFSASVLGNVATAAVLYVISYLGIQKWRDVQAKQQEQRISSCVNKSLDEWKAGGINEYPTLRAVDWKAAILSADHTIDVCVQGWDGLVDHYREDWAEFFRKGGQANLILPDEESGAVRYMADRLKRSVEDQKTEIHNTHRWLTDIQKEWNSGSVQLHPVSAMIWYCLIRIDGRVAYLSFYEHDHGTFTDSPVFQMTLERFPKTRAWIDKEMRRLMVDPLGKITQAQHSTSQLKAARSDHLCLF
jgi:hypothetical protein